MASVPIVRFLADALRFYMEFHSRFDGFYGAFIHDPLASQRRRPDLIRTEAVTVDVELTGELTTGENSGRLASTLGRPPNVDVAVEADTATFLDRRGPRGRLAADRADVAI